MRNPARWACVLVLAATGCGGPSGGGDPSQAGRERDILNGVGELYRIYVIANNKPPGGLKDLAPLQPAAARSFDALKAGEVVVRYGAVLPDTNPGTSATSSDEVLAYAKDAAERGGGVLMLDRTVRTMTADEFKAARKAGKG